MQQLTHRSLWAIFWWKMKRPLYPSHPTLQIWLQRTFFCFLSWNLPWRDAVSTHLTRSRKIRRRSCLPFQKKRSKVGRNAGSGVLLARESTLKATNLNKLYLSTYSFYYNSPVFYWSYLVSFQSKIEFNPLNRLHNIHTTKETQIIKTYYGDYIKECQMSCKVMGVIIINVSNPPLHTKQDDIYYTFTCKCSVMMQQMSTC